MSGEHKSRNDGAKLAADLRERIEKVCAAGDRSRQMERDFLEKKVLNREANEAMEDFGRKRGQLGEYLLQRADEIVAALSVVSETAFGVWKPTEATYADPLAWLSNTGKVIVCCVGKDGKTYQIELERP